MERLGSKKRESWGDEQPSFGRTHVFSHSCGLFLAPSEAEGCAFHGASGSMFFIFIFFRTHLHCPKSHFLSFHAIPHSFAKTPGWGVSPLLHTRNKMKPQTADSVSVRCAHRTAGGRQCRLLASDATSGLCPQHRAAQKQEQEDDHFQYLIRNYQCFQTAQGINHSLGNLYALLAQNLISPRRAAVLAYVSSLMLRTLPQLTPTTPPESPSPNRLINPYPFLRRLPRESLLQT
jgi:hypothetical protein